MWELSFVKPRYIYMNFAVCYQDCGAWEATSWCVKWYWHVWLDLTESFTGNEGQWVCDEQWVGKHDVGHGEWEQRSEHYSQGAFHARGQWALCPPSISLPEASPRFNANIYWLPTIIEPIADLSNCALDIEGRACTGLRPERPRSCSRNIFLGF